MTDRDLRNAALFAVRRQWRRHGDAVPWGPISDGFRHGGQRIPFLSPFEGVFKPRQLRRGALSVRSTIASRYDDERRYGVSEVRTRLFQAHFRREVLGAYGRRCSVCALKESPLLDGAHLVPDREEARPDPGLVAHRWEAAREG